MSSAAGPPGSRSSSFFSQKEQALYYNVCMTVISAALTDTIRDTLTLVPFLFLTYVAMEWLERKTEEQSVALLSCIGKFSHIAGAGIGLIPQCGFSAAAASLYSGGVITAGKKADLVVLDERMRLVEIL